MKNVRDITGQKFNRWTVLYFDKFVGEIPSRTPYWICQCECGTIKSIASNSLGRGSKSCGCYKKESGTSNRLTHGMSYSGEYLAWNSMRMRCTKPSQVSYERYGARGITVCERWMESFENFFADMGPKPSPVHQLERKDNMAGYSPENCCWITAKENARNRRSSRYVMIDGIKLTIAEAAEKLGIHYEVARRRFHKKGIVI